LRGGDRKKLRVRVAHAKHAGFLLRGYEWVAMPCLLLQRRPPPLLQLKGVLGSCRRCATVVLAGRLGFVPAPASVLARAPPRFLPLSNPRALGVRRCGEDTWPLVRRSSPPPKCPI